jgi:hypothetical protein
MAQAFEGEQIKTTVPANADLSSAQYYLSKINSSGNLATCSVRGERAHGVLLNDPAAAAREASLCVGGITQVEAGGTFSPGQALTTNASGKAILANLPSDIVIGTALETGTSGERCSMVVGVAGGYISDPAKVVYEDFESYGTNDTCAAIQFDGTAADGTAEAVNILYARDNIFAYAAMGTQTITAPVITANGLNIGMDQTDNDGVEIWTHMTHASGRPFIVGNDAAFYFTCTVNLATIAGTDDCHIGFRRAEIMNATYDNYLDLAAIGMENADGTIDLTTILNNAATTVTDTTDTIVAATDTQFKILVSAAGVVTYQHDIAAAGTLAAPTAVAAFTFDDGDPVIPFVHMLQANAAQTGVFTINQWDVGYQ